MRRNLPVPKPIVDIFEFLDLDPAIDEIVYEEGLRYHRHPNGRFGSDILLDFYAFGLPAGESVARAQALSEGVPHWLEPFGDARRRRAAGSTPSMDIIRWAMGRDAAAAG